MTNLNDLEKIEVVDANNLRHIQYRCVTCHTVHLDVPISMLEFMQSWEDANKVEDKAEPKPKDAGR